LANKGNEFNVFTSLSESFNLNASAFYGKYSIALPPSSFGRQSGRLNTGGRFSSTAIVFLSYAT